MKILSTEEIRNLDQFTINEGISSIDLMERAATTFCNWFTEHFRQGNVVRILCGPGNNGGDGLAIGRILFEKGYKIEIDLVNPLGTFSKDAEINLKRLPVKILRREIKEIKDIPLNYSSEIIIDALFGSGLNRPLQGIFSDFINAVNQWGATVIAVDIPSGVFCDELNINDAKIKASYTLSFQLPKLAFLLESNSEFIGEWILLPIGLSEEGIKAARTDYSFSTVEDILPILKKRKRFSHKGDFGHVCMIAGSKGKIGASILAGKAALRSGAGLVTMYIPSGANQIVQTALPEAMCISDLGEEYLVDFPEINIYDVIGIGPGIGQNEETLNTIEALLEKAKSPCVFDADALNLLSKNEHLLKLLPENSILTPHPGEFKRLAGQWEDDIEKLKLQLAFSKKYKCIIVLKGAYTSISDPNGKLVFNSTGNPGMATAGSGDVLTGIITAFLAKGIHPFEAAQLAAFIHGLAGDLALYSQNEESLIASDIIDHLGAAFDELD